MKLTEIDHFSHRHKLELSFSQTPFQCDGCKELGFGSCYGCTKNKCDFHLHEKCAMADPFATHSFFKNRKFKFRKKRKRGKRCIACGKDIQGFTYKSKKAYLHPCCLKLPNNINGDEGLSLNLKEKASTMCLICKNKEIDVSKGKLKGWAYVSTCGKQCFHVGCVNNMNFQNWKMGYFNERNYSNLVLINQGNIGENSSGRRREKSKGLWLMAYALILIVQAVSGAVVGALLASKLK